MLQMVNGSFGFANAPSGTAGNAVSFTQAMTLDASGNLGVGTTLQNERLRLNSSSTSQARMSISYADSTIAFFGSYSGIVGSGNATDVMLSATNVLAFGAGGTTERARIDSSGNLGIGTSSPGAKLEVSVGRAATVNSGIFSTSGTGVVGDQNRVLVKNVNTLAGANLGVGIGGYLEASASNKASLLLFYDNGTATTEGARLDSSGNLGLGTTSPLMPIQVSNYGGLDGNTNTFIVRNNVYYDVVDARKESIKAGFSTEIELDNDTGSIVFRTTSSSAAGANVAVTTTERARITSDGNLLVGTNDAAQGSGNGNKLVSGGGVWVVNAATADGFSYYNSSAAAYRFYVNSAGTISATNTTISAISDQRLKENIQDLDVGLDKIMALKPRKFDWKAGKGKNIKGDRGWIAQEFEQVFPDMIDEWKDPAPEGEDPYKSVRADLIPVLVKAIQEQQAMINELKAEVAALKGA
jgi:hypothetical protein